MVKLGGMTDEIYFAIAKMSASSIKLCKTSYNKFDRRGEFEETPAMKFGTGFHLFLLDQQEFFRQYHVIQYEGKRVGSAYEKAYNTAKYLYPDKKLIDLNDFKRYNEMSESIWSHPKANYLFSGDTMVEEALFFDYDLPIRLRCDKFKSIEFKGKLDIINNSKRLVIDLKTISDIEKAEKALKYDYCQQGYLYKQACELNFGGVWNVVYIFVESKSPYDVHILGMSSETLERGREVTEKGLNNYLEILRNPDGYKGYSKDIIFV